MLKDWLEDLTLSTDSMQSLSTSHDFIFFQKGKKKILQFIWNFKESQIAKTILRRKNKVRGLPVSDFKTYYKAKVIKTLWY